MTWSSVGHSREDICEKIGPLPGQCPAVRVELVWENWLWVHGGWPLTVQLLLSVLFLLVLHPAYVEAYYRRGSRFKRLVTSYVGTTDREKVGWPIGLVCLYLVQQVSSATAVCIWVWHTYWRQTTPGSRLALLVLSCVDLLSWVAGRLAAGCQVSSLWEMAALVDVLTDVPVLVQSCVPLAMPQGFDDWLTLHFLRSFSALHAFERARSVSQLDEHTAGVAQALVQMILRVVALLTIMAGTILTFEVLGDPPWLRDTYLETPGGDRVSFLQMVYWIVVSITTVGYGDFAPTTVITRVFTMVFIVIGVASIYYIQYTLTDMLAAQHEGTGSYWQRSGVQRHVVVILCHHGSASRMASLLHGFLQELLHATHNQTEDHHDHASSVLSHVRLWFSGAPPRHMQTWPDVVLFSPTKWEEEDRRGGSMGSNPAGSSFREFLQAAEDFPLNAQRRIWFLVGQITRESDLDRACIRDSALTYVVSDLTSNSPDEDDAQTIYSAVVLRDLYPDVRLRLMVMKPESKVLAVQAGIEPTRVFSSRELSASLLAQNARCRGLIPAVTAMMKSVDAEDEEFFLRKSAKTDRHSNHHFHHSGSADLPEDATEEVTRTVSRCRNLSEIEQVLRKSQTMWCPQKHAYERRDPWMFEYFEGVANSIFGFELNSRFSGLGYGDLVMQLYEEGGALLLGVQSRGQFILCPQGAKWTAKAGQICIALARNAESLDSVRMNPEDRTSWRAHFQAARQRRRHKDSKLKGRHLNAAALMGQRLQRSLDLVSEDERIPVSPGGAQKAAQAHAACRGREISEPTSPGQKDKEPRLVPDPLPVIARAARDETPELPPWPVPPGSASGAQAAAASARGIARGALVGPPSSAPDLLAGSPALRARQPPRLLEVDIAEDASEGRMTRQCSAFSISAPVRDDSSAMTASDPHLRSGHRGGASGSSYHLGSDVAAVRKLRQTLATGEDLIVLIVCHGDIWQQVRTFVATLRQDYLPYLVPLVILAPTPPPPGMLEDCCWRVACFHGSCLRAQVLIEAGVMEAGTVVVMAGESSRHIRFPDYRMVLTGQELECWLGASAHEAFTTFELFDSRSCLHLPKLRGKLPSHRQGLLDWMKKAPRSPALSRQTSGALPGDSFAAQRPSNSKGAVRLPTPSLDVDEDYGVDEIMSPVNAQRAEANDYFGGLRSDLWEESSYFSADEDDDDERGGSGIEAEGHRRPGLLGWLRDISRKSPVLEDKSHDSIMFDARFAAGQIFSPELWGMMLGRMFYMPVVIEFMEALVLPVTRHQQVFPWQVRVPEQYVGRPFADLFNHLACGVPIWEVEASAESQEYPFHGATQPDGSPRRHFTVQGSPAVPFALYRLRGDFDASMQEMNHVDPDHRLTAMDVTHQASLTSNHTAEGIGGHQFVVLAPKSDTLLRAGDWAIVLAGKRFGHRAYERGLLREYRDLQESNAGPAPGPAPPQSTSGPGHAPGSSGPSVSPPLHIL